MSTNDTIREIIGGLLVDDAIADYHVRPDCIRVELHDGTWVAVSPDFDPGSPENDADVAGYIWTYYASDDPYDIIDEGGDCTTATLADTIRRLAA